MARQTVNDLGVVVGFLYACLFVFNYYVCLVIKKKKAQNPRHDFKACQNVTVKEQVPDKSLL